MLSLGPFARIHPIPRSFVLVGDVYSLVTPQTAETLGPNDPVELICDYQGTRGRMLYEPITIPRPTTARAHKRRGIKRSGGGEGI